MKISKDKPEAETKKEKAKMLRELTKAKKDGYRIVYIDETMFTRKSIPSKEYYPLSKNMTVDQSRLNEPTLRSFENLCKN